MLSVWQMAHSNEPWPNILHNHQRYNTRKTSLGKVSPIPTSPLNHSNYPPDPASMLLPDPKMELHERWLGVHV